MKTEANNLFSSRPDTFAVPATGHTDSSAATTFRWRVMGIVMLIMAVTA